MSKGGRMSYNITQRMLCAAEHTYRITGNGQILADTVDGLPHSSCVGYRGSIEARQSIGEAIALYTAKGNVVSATRWQAWATELDGA